MESFHTYLKLLIPIFRRGENPDYNNYHPISLISNLSKLMEKIVHLKDFTAFLWKTLSFLSDNIWFSEPTIH